eukprot:CAMPEP_0194033096 /NCGR_PEP_ID=MMETSP0009_2-20130614/5891_1 /TAXON_ID=210454 /ORGANISM="Grammatophora oceanica, Strain CCMP 410" /LENGTH=74 /DNA_ID=CAMNT_0038673715 /DNA_START=310 /DNA_END=534 /DNA_ORIENTATION=-
MLNDSERGQGNLPKREGLKEWWPSSWSSQQVTSAPVAAIGGATILLLVPTNSNAADDMEASVQQTINTHHTARG